jgi:hypothetical protein
MNDINKELAGLLGIPRHRTGKAGYCEVCGHHSCFKHNPDFISDAGKIELLRLMMKREDWPEFCNSIGHSYATKKIPSSAYYYIWMVYILDTTGRLAQAAVEFLRKEIHDLGPNCCEDDPRRER